jgi:hypothetical protein
MKIFGVGLNKTGTKTLSHCLKTLGFKHKSYDFSLLQQAKMGNIQPLINEVKLYDSFEDWPYPLYFQQLDEEFSNSKFILTYRSSPEVWLKSLELYSLGRDPQKGMISRTLAYGYPYPQCNRDYFLRFYQNHIIKVKNYFSKRPLDLLEICWENGDGYEKLCSFLNKSILNQSVPHLNKFSTTQNHNFELNLSILKILNCL